MDPISIALMLGGAAVSVIGGAKSASASSDYNQANKASIALQQKVEAQRQQAMELDARRKEMEIIRTQQRARSLALTNSTAQGASLGSGLQGGYGQISGQSGVNTLGIQQNLGIGRNIFGLNEQISQQKIAMSDANQQMQLGQGLTSFGGSLMGSAQSAGKIFSGYGNGVPKTDYFGQSGGIYGQLGPMV